MEAYAYEITLEKNGVLSLTNLPFNSGDKVEVIILSRSKPPRGEKHYPFWGEPITYLDPTEPVAEKDWEVYK